MIAVALVLTAGCGGNQISSPSTSETPRATELLIKARQLPGGYRLARGSDDLGRPNFCGVSIEPGTVRDFAKERYTRTVAGPFLYQYVFISDPAATRSLVQRLTQRLRSCESNKVTTDAGQEITFDVTVLEDMSFYGEASVGFPVTPRPNEGKG